MSILSSISAIYNSITKDLQSDGAQTAISVLNIAYQGYVMVDMYLEVSDVIDKSEEYADDLFDIVKKNHTRQDEYFKDIISQAQVDKIKYESCNKAVRNLNLGVTTHGDSLSRISDTTNMHSIGLRGHAISKTVKLDYETARSSYVMAETTEDKIYLDTYKGYVGYLFMSLSRVSYGNISGALGDLGNEYYTAMTGAMQGINAEIYNLKYRSTKSTLDGYNTQGYNEFNDEEQYTYNWGNNDDG